MNRFNGYQRIGIILSIAWLLLASFAYRSNIDRTYSFDNKYDPRSPWLLSWDLYVNFTFGLPLLYKDIPTYVKTPGGFDRPSSYTLKFSPSGFATLVFVPIALLWGAGYAISWIGKGFKPKSSGNAST